MPADLSLALTYGAIFLLNAFFHSSRVGLTPISRFLRMDAGGIVTLWNVTCRYEKVRRVNTRVVSVSRLREHGTVMMMRDQILIDESAVLRGAAHEDRKNNVLSLMTCDGGYLSRDSNVSTAQLVMSAP